MKDLISKVTFGFLMAQFVPGVIVVYSLSILFMSIENQSSILNLANIIIKPIDLWLAPPIPTRQIMIFLVLSTGSGMAIHGLHWAVLGYLENCNMEKKDGRLAKLKNIFKSFWHDKLIIQQIIMGPIKILIEIIEMLLFADQIKDLAIEENVTKIGKDKMAAFNFLQDFYLNFAQFYAHTSYALVLLFCCFLLAGFLIPALYNSVKFWFVLIAIWLTSGYFFVISRVQLASLFDAENELKNRHAL